MKSIRRRGKLGAFRPQLNCNLLETRLAPSAFAVGGEFQANTYTTSDQTKVATAMDADGDFVVVWQSYMQDGSSHGIYGRLYNSAGSAVTAEFRVNTTTASFQTEPSVAMDSDGDFVVVWLSGASSALIGQRYASSGTPIGGEFTINTSGSATTPEVTIGSAGNFAVAWGTSATVGGIAYRRYDSSGSPIDALQLPVVVTATGPVTQPLDVAADAAGNFVVAWVGQPIGMSSGIYVRQIPATGTPAAAEVKANTMATTQTVSYPQVAVDADGDFVVVWRYNGVDSGDIYGRKYAFGMTPTTGEFKVNEFTGYAEITPDVAIDADGDFAVTWGSIGNPGGSSYDIYARCFTATAAPDGGEFRVNTLIGFTQYESVIAMDPDGDFVVAWPSNAISSGNNEISVQRFSEVARVFGVTVNGGDVQRSRVTTMAVTFTATVSIDPGAFTLTRIGGGAVGTVDFTTAIVDGRTVATLSFSGAETEFTSLVDGRYILTVDDASVTDPLGADLDGDGDGVAGGDYVLVGDPAVAPGLFRFFGDMTGDGSVAANDFIIFRQYFNGVNPALDFDNDGAVAASDFVQFRLRFGGSI